MQKEHATSISYQEDKGGNFVRNVGTSVTGYAALRTRQPFTPAIIARYAQSKRYVPFLTEGLRWCKFPDECYNALNICVITYRSTEKHENFLFQKIVAINFLTKLRCWDEAASVV